MATETTTTTAADLLFAEWVSAFIVPNLYAFTSTVPHAREEDMTGKPTLTIRWPQAPELTAAAVAEGSDLDTQDAGTTDSATATISEVGVAIELTDLLVESDILSSSDWYSRQMLQAQEVKVNADVAALFSSFAATGSPFNSGSTVAEADLLDAINALEIENAPKPYVAVFASKSIGQLRKDLSSSGNANLFGHVQDIQGQTSQYGPVNKGMAFSHFGVDIENDNTVATAHTGADYVNGVFADDFALGYAHKWQNRVELQRRALGRSTVIALTTAKGEAVLKDTAGAVVQGTV